MRRTVITAWCAWHQGNVHPKHWNQRSGFCEDCTDVIFRRCHEEVDRRVRAVLRRRPPIRVHATAGTSR